MCRNGLGKWPRRGNRTSRARARPIEPGHRPGICDVSFNFQPVLFQPQTLAAAQRTSAWRDSPLPPPPRGTQKSNPAEMRRIQSRDSWTGPDTLTTHISACGNRRRTSSIWPCDSRFSRNEDLPRSPQDVLTEAAPKQ